MQGTSNFIKGTPNFTMVSGPFKTRTRGEAWRDGGKNGGRPLVEPKPDKSVFEGDQVQIF